MSVSLGGLVLSPLVRGVTCGKAELMVDCTERPCDASLRYLRSESGELGLHPKLGILSAGASAGVGVLMPLSSLHSENQKSGYYSARFQRSEVTYVKQHCTF